MQNSLVCKECFGNINCNKICIKTPCMVLFVKKSPEKTCQSTLNDFDIQFHRCIYELVWKKVMIEMRKSYRNVNVHMHKKQL